MTNTAGAARGAAIQAADDSYNAAARNAYAAYDAALDAADAAYHAARRQAAADARRGACRCEADPHEPGCGWAAAGVSVADIWGEGPNHTTAGRERYWAALTR